MLWLLKEKQLASFLAVLILIASLLPTEVAGARAKLKNRRNGLKGQKQQNADKKTALATAEEKPASKQRPFFLLPWIVDNTFNPIRGYPFFYLYALWIFPGFLAMAVGWLYPWYEYIKNGYTHYNPGIIMDKEFSEFATWYFKHKVYKKKYWNLDAYLYRYYHSNNDNLKNFYEEKDIPVNAGYHDGDGGYNGADRVDSHAGSADPPFEDVLGGILQDLVETNPSLKKFVNYMTEGDGFEELKKILEGVIQEEFMAEKKRLGGDQGDKDDSDHQISATKPRQSKTR